MERLFDLDFQLLHDAILTAVSVFFLFMLLSYLLFNPVRDMLNKRREKLHLLKGLKRILLDIDKAIKIIDKAKFASVTPATA